MQVELQPAFLLHSRPYRDTSLILELLTEDYGRVAAVCRGGRGRGKQGQRMRAVLQPFVPLLVSWSGRSELKTSRHIEAQGAPLTLSGERLFCGLYVNEILCRLLARDDSLPAVFEAYQATLEALKLASEEADIPLRRFELLLLDQLGYGFSLEYHANGEQAVEADNYYRYEYEKGLVAVESGSSSSYLGADLLGLAEQRFTPGVRRVAKKLCRQALRPYLGDKPIRSRELFQS